MGGSEPCRESVFLVQQNQARIVLRDVGQLPGARRLAVLARDGRTRIDPRVVRLIPESVQRRRQKIEELLHRHLEAFDVALTRACYRIDDDVALTGLTAAERNSVRRAV